MPSAASGRSQEQRAEIADELLAEHSQLLDPALHLVVRRHRSLLARTSSVMETGARSVPYYPPLLIASVIPARLVR